MNRSLKYSSAILASLIFSFAPTLALDVNGVGISAAVAQTPSFLSRRAEAVRLNEEGIEQIKKGNFRLALERFEKALAISRETDFKSSQGLALTGIGLSYEGLGEYPKALVAHLMALDIYKEIDDKLSQGMTLQSIGSMYDAMGQYSKAVEHYTQALAIFKEIGDKEWEEVTIRRITNVLRIVK